MRYLDLIRERRDSDRKPAQLIVDVVSQRGKCDPNAFLEELPLKTDTPAPTYIHQTIAAEVIPKGSQTSAKTTPFEVGDKITYRVPGDPERGPFEVIMVSPDHYQGGWWALVLKPSENEGVEPKPDTLALAPIHQIIVTRVIPKESLTP